MDNYKKSKLIALAILFFMTGIVGTRPLIPLLSNDWGANAFQIGIIMSLFSFIPLFLAVKLGHLIDKVGTTYPLIISGLIGGGSLFLPLLLDSLVGVYLSQLLGGVAQTAFALAAQSYVSNLDDGKARERHVSMFSLGVSGGGFIGPFIGGFIADWLGYAESISLFGVFLFIACGIIYILDKQDDSKHFSKEVKLSINHSQNNHVLLLLKESSLRKAVFISMIVLLARDLYLYYFPLLANEYGYSATIIGLIIAAHNGAGIVIRIALTFVIEKWGKSEAVVTSIFLSGLVYAMVPFMNSLVLSFVIAIMLGLFLGLGQPLSISTTAHFSPKDRLGEVLGLRLTFNRLAQFVSPIIFGGIASLLSLSVIFWVISGVLMLGSTQSYIKSESKRSKSTG